MQADRPIYATLDDRLVEAGDPEARFLRYAPGDELTAADQTELAAVAAAAAEAAERAAAEQEAAERDAAAAKELGKPADKARARPSTKAAG